ncbi:pyridoxamine 5'-phosphate oxidase family protein [Streptomyces sp. W16]|uniref:pyridoxamine 5'-phosphate oxidase family protein n=1 Tax=Streptomyces sp. W16 TaxID=3076631 RepID=UPI00295BBC9E|nr:pyridoxamine 5'-phosphate oxidase family protein [Streptomyces sp. W16]MDV9169515.1 pyridoxamine 5'-phosphate oxidase family protein [Streptomyces sp. W16]
MSEDAQPAIALLARTDHGRVATTLRALPFLAFAGHIVQDGRLLLRMPRSFGHHHACVGSVVAYGADNLDSAGPGEELWSVQVIGTCEPHEPTTDQVERFGPARDAMVYLRIEPRLGTVHSVDGGLERHFGPTL